MNDEENKRQRHLAGNLRDEMSYNKILAALGIDAIHTEGDLLRFSICELAEKLRQQCIELASLTPLDFATLDQVPKVEWESVEHGGYGTEQWEHEQWTVLMRSIQGDAYPVLLIQPDGKGESWSTVDHAKRHVEIKLHLAEIERKLLKELVEK